MMKVKIMKVSKRHKVMNESDQLQDSVCKVQLDVKEQQILDEICKYSNLSKSDAIYRALKYYHDDQCPCSTEQKAILDKAANKGYLNGFEFSVLVQNLLVSENGYVIDTGNWMNANAAVALRLVKQISKHPTCWKRLFMVA